MIKLRGQRSQGWPGSVGGGGQACRNLSFQTYGGGAAGPPRPKPELFTEFYVFWVLPGGSFRSSVRLRHILSFLSLGLCFAAWTDRQDGLGCRGRGWSPLHPWKSILTQWDINLTSPPSFPPCSPPHPISKVQTP